MKPLTIAIVGELVGGARHLDVIAIHPRARRLRRDELEAEGAHAPAAGAGDRLDVRAGHPQRGMRLLERLGDDVARGKVEVLPVPLVALLREGRHQGAHRLFPHLALLANARPEGMQLDGALPFAEPELDAPAGQEIERGHALRDPDRMIRGELHDAVSQPDALRALAGGAQEDLRRRAVRVLLEEVVLDAPRVVEAEPVGELDLREGVVQELVFAVLPPGAGQLQLVEDAESHGSTVSQDDRRNTTAGSPGCWFRWSRRW
jgi:hypothetical protein